MTRTVTEGKPGVRFFVRSDLPYLFSMKREIDVSFLVKRDLLSSHWQLFSVITCEATTVFFFCCYFSGNVKKPSSKLENNELVEGVLRSKLSASQS